MYGYDEMWLRGSIIKSTMLWNMAADRNVQEGTLLEYVQQFVKNAKHIVTLAATSTRKWA